MKRLALAVAFLVSTGGEAQTLRRVPLTGYVDRTGQVVEPDRTGRHHLGLGARRKRFDRDIARGDIGADLGQGDRLAAV